MKLGNLFDKIIHKPTRSYPPDTSQDIIDLVETGRWSCDETENGWVIKTEGYSWCCNPGGQSLFYFNIKGDVIRQTHIGEDGIEKDVKSS